MTQLFGAAWTPAYAAPVAPLGLEVLALHDGHGPRGPLGTQALAARERERSEPASLRPGRFWDSSLEPPGRIKFPSQA